MVMTSSLNYLVNGIAQTCFSGRAKGKFLLRRTTLQQKNQGFALPTTIQFSIDM